MDRYSLDKLSKKQILKKLKTANPKDSGDLVKALSKKLFRD